MWTVNFQMFKLDLEKGRGTRDQIANICQIIEKAREFQKKSTSALLTSAKAFDCMDHNKLWKIIKEMEYQTSLPASWEICVQVKKQQLELDMYSFKFVPQLWGVLSFSFFF